ncbi:MAG: hypothetical protein IKN28_04875, partial [Firmicutes bacterium]|nr:hypothetical protein [Bacillota bacterium]
TPYEPVQGINDVHETHYFTSNEIRLWKYNYTVNIPYLHKSVQVIFHEIVIFWFVLQLAAV